MTRLLESACLNFPKSKCWPVTWGLCWSAGTIRDVRVCRAKVLAPVSPREFTRALLGAKFCGLARRGKYLLFELRQARRAEPRTLVGHLGMTGRMYLLPARARLPSTQP